MKSPAAVAQSATADSVFLSLQNNIYSHTMQKLLQGRVELIKHLKEKMGILGALIGLWKD